MTKRTRARRQLNRPDMAATRDLAAPTDRIVRDDWSRLAPTLDLLRADIAHLFAEFSNLTPEQVKLLKNQIEATP